MDSLLGRGEGLPLNEELRMTIITEHRKNSTNKPICSLRFNDERSDTK